MYATTMSRPTINPRLWIIMAVMIALVSVSWEDAALSLIGITMPLSIFLRWGCNAWEPYP